MNLRPPPILTGDAKIDIKALSEWAAEIYEFLKYPAFHVIKFVPRASKASRQEGDLYYDSGTDKLTLGVAVAWESISGVALTYWPAFCVHPSATQTNLATDTPVNILFATERYDQGNDFSSPTFTAPVDGKYSLSVMLKLDNLDKTANYYSFRFTTSNETYHFDFDPNQFVGDPGYWAVSLCIDADFDANDTVEVQFYQAAGAAQTDVNVDSFFSGHLIG